MAEIGGLVVDDDPGAGPSIDELRRALHPFVARPLRSALRSFGQDVAAWLALLVLAVVVEHPMLDAVIGVTIGIVTGNLFMMGHDAAHGSFTHLRRLNAVLARFCFTVNWHPTSSWRFVHHEIHHSLTNDGGHDVVWRPPTLDDYHSAGVLGRAWTRLTRSSLGFGAYYLREVWWRELLRQSHGLRRHDAADIVSLMVMVGASTGLGWWSGGWWGAVCLTLIPLAVVGYWIGFVTYFNHTHPAVAWHFEPEVDHEANQLDGTVRLYYPAPVAFFLGNIMEHPAHHVHPGVPLANLDKAQAHLQALLGDRALEQQWTPRTHRWMVRTCKLYDPEQHAWLDWDGTVLALAGQGMAAVEAPDASKG
ncbi:MAG: fatty acid desaturase [Actinomycetota bacterium]